MNNESSYKFYPVECIRIYALSLDDHFSTFKVSKETLSSFLDLLLLLFSPGGQTAVSGNSTSGPGNLPSY